MLDLIPTLDVDEQIVSSFKENCVWTAGWAASVYVPDSSDFKLIDIGGSSFNIREPVCAYPTREGCALAAAFLDPRVFADKFSFALHTTVGFRLSKDLSDIRSLNSNLIREVVNDLYVSIRQRQRCRADAKFKFPCHRQF